MAIKVNNSFYTDEVTYQNLFYEKLFGDDFEVNIDRNTDGYIDGTIFEHKQNVMSYGRSKALSQALIYLVRFNRDGIPVPKNIMLVSQDEKKVYLYDANDYSDIINNIPKYSTMQASQGIIDFKERKDPQIIKYDLENSSKNLDLLNTVYKTPEYVKVDINIHNVFGWSLYFYDNASKPKKVEFFKEIRNPKKELSDFINPWKGEEKDFSLIMDLLNDPLVQKRLGAYYTPSQYARKAVELVRMAIRNVPQGNDYIILDRCAGTGNLEMELSEEELSHVIVNTYEVKEWHALKDRLGNLVRCILPPIPQEENTYPVYDKDGCLEGSNALTKAFVVRKEIKQYIDDPNCNIIIFENPPYSDDAGDTPETGVSRGNSEANDLTEVMNSKFKSDFKGLVLSKDPLNVFIWSGFEYYLKKPDDAFIVFAPLKYWKTGHLVNKEYVKGYLFNREHFHASAEAVSCIYWKNKDFAPLETIKLEVFDIVDEKIKKIKNIDVKKIHVAPSEKLFDKRTFDEDEETGIYCQRNGLEGHKKKSTGTKNIYNKNIIGWVHLVGMSFNPKNCDLTRTTLNLRKNGFYLREDNFIEKLPLFCAKTFSPQNWYESNVYFTSGDGGDSYVEDKEFLKKCLIYTCLTQKNRCRSLCGSDGRNYQNELCLEKGTISRERLNAIIKFNPLSEEEKLLTTEYNDIIKEIGKRDKDTNEYIYEEYNNSFKYGIFQIEDEINISIVIGQDKKGKDVLKPKYGDLNNLLSSFKKKVQNYYNKNIVDDLIKYELLK